ncbi:MAG: ChbG/HpnK family deacetylase [candidate division NC10 bacterium]|nr:ChbG/HpnK family deacetylase [candidate division NC10 bacterium]
MPPFLIVNADDFNLTEGVTRGILEAHRCGIVTSTTVMVNLPGLERSRDLVREASHLGLGLHLNWGCISISPSAGPSCLPQRWRPWWMVPAASSGIAIGWGRRATCLRSGKNWPPRPNGSR